MENEPAAPPRRVRVEQNIYRRPSGVYEVGFKDVDGRKRWRRVDGGISAARVVQNEAAGHSGVEASGLYRMHDSDSPMPRRAGSMTE